MDKKKILNILEWVGTILIILLACSWFLGIKVKTNSEGETVCYNLWNHEVKCR